MSVSVGDVEAKEKKGALGVTDEAATVHGFLVRNRCALPCFCGKGAGRPALVLDWLGAAAKM